MATVRALPHEVATDILAALFAVGPGKRALIAWRKAVGVVLIGALLIYWLAVTTDSPNAGVAPVFLLLFFAWGAPALRLRSTQRRTFPRAALQLAGWVRDAKLAAPLLQTFRIGDWRTRMELSHSLADCLPLLNAEGLGSLAPAERATLVRQLFADSDNIRLQIAAADAVQRAEMVSAIPQVERLLHGTSDPDVTRAAEACLSRLREVRDAQKLGADLLRPSQPASAPETLLRSATPADDEDERQLLRPGNPEVAH